MSTPAGTPAPAAPAAAGTPAEAAAPKSLADKQRELKSMRLKPTQAPSQGSFVKVGGKTMVTKPAPVAPDLAAKPTAAGAKAGAPAQGTPAEQVAPDNAAAEKRTPTPEAAETPKPDAFAELKKDRDARARELADLRKQLGEFEELGKTDFRKLVERLAGHYKADPKEVAQALLLEHATKWQREQELAAMTPEDRALHEAAEKWKEHEAGEKVRLEKEATEAKEAEGRKTYELTSTKLIEAHKLLPESIRNHPDFAGRAALRIKDRLVALALAADPAMPADEFLATVDPAKLAAETLAEHRAELRLALEASDEAGLDELLNDKVRAQWMKKLQAEARKKAHPALVAQPRAGDGKFVKADEKPAPKPLHEMKPAWSSFLPRRAR